MVATIRLTEEQESVVAAMHSGVDVAVNAVAGSAKSTTAKYACDGMSNVTYVAFNVHNVKESKAARVNANCVTTCSLGYRGLAANIGGTGLTPYNDKSLQVFKKLNLGGSKYAFQQAFNAYRLLDYTQPSGWDELVEHTDIKIHSSWSNRSKDILACNEELYVAKGQIDFTDMLYLPNKILPKGWLRSESLIIDEFNDTSAAARHMVFHAIGDRQKVVLGDREQAIFLFAYADPANFDRVSHFNQATLSTSFRCPSEVVEEAQQYVPGINAFRQGGHVEELDSLPAALPSGSLVVGSKYKYILPYFLDHAFQGHSVGLRGCEYLFELSKKVSKESQLKVHRDMGFTSLCYKLADDVEEQLEKTPLTLANQEKRTNLSMKRDALLVATQYFNSIDEFLGFSNKFSAKKTADVWFSSIHRCKGSESENVFVLNYAEMEEEACKDPLSARLAYVAVTRSKENLYLCM
jgi:DNA helicase II / ATP-dependent DNA helicase PcrA